MCNSCMLLRDDCQAMSQTSKCFCFSYDCGRTPVPSTELRHVARESGPRRLQKSRPQDRSLRGDQAEFHRAMYHRRNVSLPLASNPTYVVFSTRNSSFLYGGHHGHLHTGGHSRHETKHSADSDISRSSSSSTKGENDAESVPTTPVLGPTKDGHELKRSSSGRSIPALAQTTAVTVEAERALSSSPKSASLSLGEAAAARSPEDVKSSAEDLPTPPDTPGPSTEAATTSEGAAEDPAETAEATDASEVVQPEPEEAEPEPPAVKRVPFHEDADLDIKVREADGEEAVYAVCSRALETASRIWKQGVPSEMEAESASALRVLFSIAHYKFADVPQRLSGDDAELLYDVALAADRSQTTSLLVPFARSWLAEIDAASSTQDQEGSSFPLDSAEKTLVAGWALGHAPWVARALAPCAHRASVGADGATLLDAEGRPWADRPVPAEVVDLLAAVRLAAVARIVRAVSDPVSKLLSGTGGQSPNPDEHMEIIRYCHAPEGSSDASVREECEELQLGSAIMGLTKARLWPPPEPARVRASPEDLARAYAGVKIRRYQTPGLRFQQPAEGEGAKVEDAHARCGFGHQAEMERTLAAPARLTAEVVEALEARARLSGVYSEEAFEGLLAEEDVKEEEEAEK